MENVAVDELLASVPAWACGRPDVTGVALVGSWARGTPSADSDVDLVILTHRPSLYLADDSWAAELRVERFIRTHAWGALTERRGITASNVVIEFGIASPEWANEDPVDPGTLQVVRGGMRILYDADGVLARLWAFCSERLESGSD